MAKQPPSRKRPSQTRITELHCCQALEDGLIQIIGVFCGKHLDILVFGGCKINLVVVAVASFLTYPVSCCVWLVGCDRSLQAAFISVAVSPMSNEEAMVEARHGPGTPQIECSNGWKSFPSIKKWLFFFDFQRIIINRRQPRAFGIE